MNLILAITLTVVGFNVESGDARPEVVSRLVETVPCDIWGFSEVKDAYWGRLFERAAERAGGGWPGADYGRVLGTTGGEDRLLIVYDLKKLELVSSFELRSVTVVSVYRAPLVARFRVRGAGGGGGGGGREFLFMVNHLARGSAAIRHEQARRLNRWAARQTLPLIAVGDYNFDWAVRGGERDHDRGYDLLTRDGVFEWIRPRPLVQTQLSVYANVLDFVFAGGPARQWRARSHVVRGQVDAQPDNRLISDHRPVLASFDLP